MVIEREIDPAEKAFITLDMAVSLQQSSLCMGHTLAVWMQLSTVNVDIFALLNFCAVSPK